jgi:hypothetical protein
MGKRKGLADRAAVQRLGLNKRWRWHWARDDKICSACGCPAVGVKHPLWHCKNDEVIEERERWKESVDDFLRGIPARHRAPLEDLWSCMQREEHGDLACCGVFLPSFLAKLDRADVSISKRDVSRLKKLTKVVGKGAREVLRVQTDQNILCRGVELRQLSIKDFLNIRPPVDVERRKPKKRPAAPLTLDEDSDGDIRMGSMDGSVAEEKEKEVRLKFPIKASWVIKNCLLKRSFTGGGVGRVSYWEFKAG